MLVIARRLTETRKFLRSALKQIISALKIVAPRKINAHESLRVVVFFSYFNPWENTSPACAS
jgi:hypothetical protein